MNIWWEDAFNYEPECCDKYVQHCSWPSPPLGPTPSCFYPLSPVSCYGRTYFLSPEKFLIFRKIFMLLKNNFTWSICSLTGSMTVSPDIVIASLWTGGTLGAHWGVGNTSYHAQWAIRGSYFLSLFVLMRCWFSLREKLNDLLLDQNSYQISRAPDAHVLSTVLQEGC